MAFPPAAAAPFLLLFLSLLSLLFSAASPVSASRHLLSTIPSLPNGAPCQLAANYSWTPPFCGGDPVACIFSSAVPSNGFLHGTCRTPPPRFSYCTAGPYRFAVGVRHIPPYGPATCELCTCNSYPQRRGQNRATCDCEPLPPCYVNANGTTVGRGCPYQIQSSCRIVRPGGGVVVGGEKTHLGKCEAPQVPLCVSAGPNWGPYFYAVGAVGVVKPGDRCRVCECGSKGGVGVIRKCKRVPGCRVP